MKTYGVESDGELSIDELKNPTTGYPLILWVHRSHWVVLDHYQNGYFYISDPANGYVKQSYDDLKDNYSGLALSAKPTLFGLRQTTRSTFRGHWITPS